MVRGVQPGYKENATSPFLAIYDHWNPYVSCYACPPVCVCELVCVVVVGGGGGAACGCDACVSRTRTHTRTPCPCPTLYARHSGFNISILEDGRFGAHGGSGLSSVGGTIRSGELDPDAPPIPHALKVG